MFGIPPDIAFIRGAFSLFGIFLSSRRCCPRAIAVSSWVHRAQQHILGTAPIYRQLLHRNLASLFCGSPDPLRSTCRDICLKTLDFPYFHWSRFLPKLVLLICVVGRTRGPSLSNHLLSKPNAADLQSHSSLPLTHPQINIRIIPRR